MSQGTSPAAVRAAEPLTIERQQDIENALSMALHYVRRCGSPEQLQRAIAKSRRALAMLKQAAEGVQS